MRGCIKERQVVWECQCRVVHFIVCWLLFHLQGTNHLHEATPNNRSRTPNEYGGCVRCLVYCNSEKVLVTVTWQTYYTKNELCYSQILQIYQFLVKRVVPYDR